MKILVLASKHKFHHYHLLAESVKHVDPSCEIDIEIIPEPKKLFGKFVPFLMGKAIKKLIEKHNTDLVFCTSIRLAHHVSKPVLCWMGGDALFEIKTDFKQLPIYVKIRRSLIFYMRYQKIRKNIEKYPILCVSNYLTNIIRGNKSSMDYRYSKKHDGFMPTLNPNVATLYKAPQLEYMTKPSTKMELKRPCVGLVQNANTTIKMKGMFQLDRVLKEMPGVMFYWVGDGPYKELAKPLEKYPNFVSLGRLKLGEVKKFLHSIDVYLLASGMDTLGVSTLEAQMMEKPVVVHNAGGTSETMQYGITGYYYNTSQDMQKYLQELLSNPELAQQMGKAGRQFVMSKFSWPAIARKFIEYSQRIVEGKPLIPDACDSVNA